MIWLTTSLTVIFGGATLYLLVQVLDLLETLPRRIQQAIAPLKVTVPKTGIQDYPAILSVPVDRLEAKEPK